MCVCVLLESMYMDVYLCIVRVCVCMCVCMYVDYFNAMKVAKGCMFFLYAKGCMCVFLVCIHVYGYVYSVHEYVCGAQECEQGR